MSITEAGSLPIQGIGYSSHSIPNRSMTIMISWSSKNEVQNFEGLVHTTTHIHFCVRGPSQIGGSCRWVSITLQYNYHPPFHKDDSRFRRIRIFVGLSVRPYQHNSHMHGTSELVNRHIFSLKNTISTLSSVTSERFSQNEFVSGGKLIKIRG